MTTVPVPALEVRKLSHRFKDHLAVDDASFSVGHGSIHGFVGPNGAGKTTTLKVLSTLEPPQEGVVRVEGLDVRTETQAVRRRVGFMPDHFSLYRTMTVQEYLEFFGAAYGLPAAERRKTVLDVLSLVDLEGRRDSVLRGLSRGMQQRVSLARVLVNDPQVMLLDEPASGLDPRARIELMEILKELRVLGKTIFISSHILSELADLCDSVTIIDRGQIRYSGSMDDLLTKRDEERSFWLELEDGLEDGSWNTLRELVGVTTVDLDPSSARARRVTFDSEKVTANQILERLIKANQTILGFREDRHRLDDVFLELTEPGLR